MVKNNLTATEWKNFRDNFKKVNSSYRQGEFEKVFAYEELAKFPESQNSAGGKITLKELAHQLYLQAENSWRTKNIPSEFYSQALRAMVISFEIDEYALSLNDEKKDFFPSVQRGVSEF